MRTVEIVTFVGSLVAIVATLFKLRRDRDRARAPSPLARWLSDRRPTPPTDPRPE